MQQHTQTTPDRRNVPVPDDLHYRMRVVAIRERKTVKQLYIEVLTDYLKQAEAGEVANG